MFAEQVLPKIYAAYKNVGKSGIPSPSDDKYQLCISRIDDAVRRWAEYPDVNWDSLYKEFSVTTNNGVASLPRDLVDITSTPLVDGVETRLIKADEKMYHRDAVYTYGASPKKIALVNREKPEVTITGEYKRTPVEVRNGKSIVECENMRWLTLYVAAQMAEGDPAKEELAPGLYQQADIEWQLLLGRYSKRVKGSPRSLPTRTRSNGSPSGDVRRFMGRTW